MIRKIEELSMNAFPSLETIHYDGWIIRISDGKSKRVNSVNMLYPSSLSMDVKIDYCESLYESLHMRKVFKLTEDELCKGYDTVLSQRGYDVAGETNLLTLDLMKIGWQSEGDCEIYTDFHRSWYLDLCDSEGKSEIDRKVVAEAWKKVIPEQCFMSIIRDGRRVAFGRGVLEQGYLGIYSVYVDPPYRRTGLGELITKGLCEYGKKNGCRSAYLQVEQSNERAASLYKKIGFTNEYKYWYRVKTV